MNLDGSWENTQVSPARQLPVIQYLKRRLERMVQGEWRLKNGALLAKMVAQIMAKSTVGS